MSCKVSKRACKQKLNRLKKDARFAGIASVAILLVALVVGGSVIAAQSTTEEDFTLDKAVLPLPYSEDLYTYLEDEEVGVLSIEPKAIEPQVVEVEVIVPEVISEPEPEPTPELVSVPHTDYERDLLLYTVELEAHDASLYHKQIIACVVVNRLYSDNFSYDTLEEVLTAKNQFSGLSNYYNRYYEPDEDTVSAVDAVLSGEIVAEEFSDGATFFYNPTRVGRKLSSFENRTFCFELEGHRFFK